MNIGDTIRFTQEYGGWPIGTEAQITYIYNESNAVNVNRGFNGQVDDECTLDEDCYELVHKEPTIAVETPLKEETDIRKRKFTRFDQFFLGEWVKIISCNPITSCSSYNLAIGQKFFIYYICNLDYKSPKKYDQIVTIYNTSGTSFTVNCQDLDLAIEDEEEYIKIKTERFIHHDRIEAYLTKEKEILLNKAKEAYKLIFESIDEVFPERWDYYIDDVIGNLNIILQFPEILISNKDKNKHVIKDLYIKLEFNSELKLVDMLGCRATINHMEYNIQYGHSHLQRSSEFWKWRSWCRGESDFAQAVVLIRNKYLKSNLLRFLYQIPHYLSWESLDGGPYIKIESLKPVNNYPSTVPNSSVEVVYKAILENVDIIPTRLIANNDKNTFQLEFSKIEELIFPYTPKNLTCIKNGDNYSIISSENSETKRNVEKWNRNIQSVVAFKFKGDFIKPKVILADNTEVNIDKKVPYPDLTNQITKRLQDNINKYALQYE